MRKRWLNKATTGGYGTIILAIAIIFAQGGFGQNNPYILYYSLGIFVGILLILYSLNSGGSKEEKELRKSSVTPEDIEKQINSSSPFLEKNISNTFRGIEVEWTVELYSIDKSSIFTRHDVLAVSPNKTELGIRFSISLRKYPQLKVMNRGQKFKVHGIIADVDNLNIHMKNCYLFFDDEKPKLDQESANQITPVQNDVMPAPTNSNTKQITTQLAIEPKRNITPLDIDKAFIDLPPFQIEQVAKNFQGIKVEWLIELSSIFSVENKWYLITRYPEQSFPQIVCPIDVEKYPQLKIMKSGETFKINGTIVSVEKGKINLDKCSLYFQ